MILIFHKMRIVITHLECSLMMEH